MVYFDLRGTNLVMTRVNKEGEGRGAYYLFSPSPTRESCRLERLTESPIWPYHGFCQCGCEWVTFSKDALDSYREPLDIACPSCGCREPIGDEFYEMLGVRLFDDPHKVAISGFLMRRKVRHNTVEVEDEDRGSVDYKSNYLLHEPSHVFPERTQFRITYNRETRRAYLVTQVGRRPRQVISLSTDQPRSMEILDHYMRRLDDDTLRTFAEKLLAELPEYIVREYRLLPLLFPEMRETDYRAYATTFTKALLLLARPYTQHGDGFFLYSPFASEQRRLVSSRGRKELFRVLFPAATNRNISLLKTLVAAGEERILPVFTLLESPEVLHNCCQAFIDEREKDPWHSMVPLTGLEEQLLAYRPSISPSVRKGFVRDLFGSTDQLHQRLIDVRYEARTTLYLVDALWLYSRCRQAAKVDEVREHLPDPGRLTIREVHDLLSDVQRKIGEKKVLFRYPETLRGLVEGRHGDLDFRLPDSNQELLDVGGYMRNCVGGYADRVKQHKELIITGYLGDLPYVCIGYLPDKKLVFEVKARFNKWLQKDDPHLSPILDYLSRVTKDIEGIDDLRQVFSADIVEEESVNYHALPF